LEIWDINPPLLSDGSYPLLHERGEIGSLLKALFGYNGNPSALEMVAYIGYLLIVSLYYIMRENKGQEKKETVSPQQNVTNV
jgi:high-affinity iron transporter